MQCIFFKKQQQQQQQQLQFLASVSHICQDFFLISHSKKIMSGLFPAFLKSFLNHLVA